MGFLSDAWDSVSDAASSAWDSTKDAASSAWGSTQDAIRDVTGVDSLNTLFATGGLAMVPANLSGKGVLGEALYDTMGPLMGMGQQQMPQGMQMSGPLMGNAPANLTMGAGGQAAPQTVNPSAQDLAGLFGDTGYQYGPSQTSTALLQANPEAYQYQPLMSGVV